MEWRFFCILNKNYKHPFKSYSEQSKILEQDKKLIIDDDYLLQVVLQDYSYYTIINGYKDIFLNKKNLSDSENFQPGTKLSYLYQVHWIDITMSSILFKYTLLVEKRLKTRVSYLVAKNFGINEKEYLSPINYSQAKYNKGRLAQVIKNISEKRNKDISLNHYDKKENNLPPWIAAKALSFGNIINWYKILRAAHKKEIIAGNNQYKGFLNPLPSLKEEELKDYFLRLIEQVYQFRNLSAHGNRTFSLNLEDKYALNFNHLKKANLNYYFDNMPKNGLYSIIFSILILLDDKYAIKNFYNELSLFFYQYDRKEFLMLGKSIYDLFNLPKNTLILIEYYIKERFD